MTDISLESDIFVTDPAASFVQQIDVLFNTLLTSALGDPYFGTDFERFLWSMRDNTDDITAYVKKSIKENCPSAPYMDWDARCVYLSDERDRDFYYIAIVIISPDGKETLRSYAIHDYGKETPFIKSASI